MHFKRLECNWFKNESYMKLKDFELPLFTLVVVVADEEFAGEGR